MSKLPIIRKFRLPIYSDRIWVVVHPSIRKAIDHVEDQIDQTILKSPNNADALCFTYKDTNGTNRTILFFKPTVNPGVIAHEAKHAINFIFAWSGVRLSIDNDEPECYLLEYLVNKIHSILSQAKPYFQPKKTHAFRQEEKILEITCTLPDPFLSLPND